MPNYDDMSLNEIFKLDSSERIKTLNQLILKLEESGDNPDLFDDAMREAHSLKAAARIVNNSEIQNLAHKMEEIIEIFKNTKKSISADAADLFLKSLDAMTDMADAFVSGKTHGVNVNNLMEVMDGAKEGKFPERPVSEKSKKVTKDDKILTDPQVIPEKREPQGGDSAKRKVSVEKVMVEKDVGESSVRVGVEKLEKMLNLSGEIYTNTLLIERQRAQAMWLAECLTKITNESQSIRTLLSENDTSSERIHEWVAKNQAQWTEFRESFLSYAEVINNVGTAFSHLGFQLQDEVMRSRMLRVGTILEPQRRFVRDVARESGKKIKLTVEGGETELDKSVLEILKDPLAHLVRNACDHGIESLEKRLEAGKPEEGQLTLSAYQQSDRVMIIVEDDGGGLNVERMREKIGEKQLLPAEKIKQLTRDEVLEFIYFSGFSTAKSVTAISGRGVGLDVVKSNISKMGGRIQVESEEGLFTRFILTLPLTLAVTKSLLVDVSGERFCFPITRVEEVVQVANDEIKTVEGREVIECRGEIIALVHLGSLWELPQEKSVAEIRSLVIVGEGREKMAFWVDAFVGEQEIVAKPIDDRLTHVTDISGGTVLDSGQIAYIVDMDSLLRSSADYTGKSLISRTEEAKQIQRKRILVVEDSLTVRQLERKMLENHGYDVVAAVDGLDGWNKVQEGRFDLVVTDIEMPRMNGFELIANMKKDKKLCEIPTIIVSFKERDEDKRQGMQVGADKYLTKSQYDNRTLLEAIGRLIGK